MECKTSRLFIRELSEADFGRFADLMEDPDVMRFSVTGSLSRAESRNVFDCRILQHHKDHGFGLWALVLLETEALIGIAGLLLQTIEGVQEVELSYRLFPCYQGKGLAKEAAMEICKYGFQKLGLDHLLSIIEPENTPSIHLAKSLGMHLWKRSSFHGKNVEIYLLPSIQQKPFQSSWQADFQNEKKRIEQVFQDLPIQLFHIGSTSIPNCFAKPIIDILGVTPEIGPVDLYNQAMEQIGFQAKGEYGMPQRRFFTKKEGTCVNFHLFEDTDPEAGRHLRFRNYLLSHPDKTLEYSALKQELADQHPHDIQSYTLAKSRWIKEIDRLAADEASENFSFFPDKAPRKSQWNTGEIAHAMEVNMHLQMTYFAKYHPSIDLVFKPGISIVRSSLADDTFNYVLRSRWSSKQAKHCIQETSSLFEEKGLPFSWWTSPSDTPAPFSQELLSQGFSFKEENIGMHCLLDGLAFHAPSPLSFCRVEKEEDVEAFCSVLVSIGLHPQTFPLIYQPLPKILYQEGACLEMYLGWAGSVPVVTGMIVFHAHAAGLYYVATCPEERKKGYGTAMMKHLLNRAQRKGYHLATLQASQEGKGLYERLGFSCSSSFKEYTRRRPDGTH